MASCLPVIAAMAAIRAGQDEEGLYADGRAALAWLDDAGVPPDRTVLFGESLGTGVAVQMAVEHPVAGLILQAPFTSTVDVGEEAVPFLPVSLFVTHRFDNMSKITGDRGATAADPWRGRRRRPDPIRPPPFRGRPRAEDGALHPRSRP